MSKRPAARRTTSRAPRRAPRRKRWRRRALLVLLGLVAVFVLWAGVLYAFARIPEPNDIAKAQSVTVVDRDGKPVGRIHAEADRVSIPLKDMPEHLRRAVIAVEDRRFYSHPGVSITSIFRAAFANIIGREVRQGGSTITQQYVKNAFVGNDRTLLRKTREAVLAVKLERQRTKDEILELYLNTIYLGRGAYGVEAASQAYFGKRAKHLSLAQSALLAGMIQAPESYEPAREPETAKRRRDLVLSLMVRDGAIGEAEAERAREQPVKVRARRAGGLAPHYLEEVRRFLEEQIGPSRLYAGGVRVSATLDVDMQRAAERAVDAVYDRKNDPEAALVAIDPKDGGVRAMVGARDYGRRQLNLATRGRRQPGSTFKPFVLAAAIADGTSDRKRYPAPARKTFRLDSGPWPVSNYDRRDYGTITIRRATEMSVNTVYAQMILDVGAEAAKEMAESAGIGSRLEAVPSLTLGTFEVSPFELTAAYATFAARGQRFEPAYVSRVVDRDGDVLYEARPDPDPAVERDVADTVNDVLEGVITSGTGGRARIDRPAAGKTGTTEEHKDAWFAGYTPDLVATVWSGYPEGGKDLRNVRGIDVTGGSFPAQIWAAFMREALSGVEPSAFADPPAPEPTASPSASGSGSPGAVPTLPTVTDLPETKPASPEPAPSKSKTVKPSPSPTKSKSPSPSPTASAPEDAP